MLNNNNPIPIHSIHLTTNSCVYTYIRRAAFKEGKPLARVELYCQNGKEISSTLASSKHVAVEQHGHVLLYNHHILSSKRKRSNRTGEQQAKCLDYSPLRNNYWNENKGDPQYKQLSEWKASTRTHLGSRDGDIAHIKPSCLP